MALLINIDSYSPVNILLKGLLPHIFYFVYQLKEA